MVGCGRVVVMVNPKRKKHRDPDVIRAEREALDRSYAEARERLSEEENEARCRLATERSAGWKAQPSPIVDAWKLTRKRFEGWEGGTPWLYTVRYADGTGNTFRPQRGAWDEETGAPRPVKGRKAVHEAYFDSGLDFEEEPSAWLRERRLWNIVRIDPADLPPLD